MCSSHCVIDTAVCVLVPLLCCPPYISSGHWWVNASGYACIIKLELALQALASLILLVACIFSDGSY